MTKLQGQRNFESPFPRVGEGLGMGAESRLKWDDQDSLFYAEYFIKDHLGNVRDVITTNPNFSNPLFQATDYYPFGLEIQEIGASDNLQLYNTKELQTDAKLWWYDYGARFYDPVLGRWHSVDPLAEKHFDYTPYAYVFNNPIKYIDPFGLDSAQRAQAAQKALEYVNKNPGDTYPSNQDRIDGNFRGAPSEKVDCSGMVDNCVLAGEEPSSKDNGKENGVRNVMAQSEKIGDLNDLSKAEVGNAITLNNTRSETLDSKRDFNHIGIITKIERDDNGNIKTLQITHSAGSAGSGRSGPRTDDAIKEGKSLYWGVRITGVYKWDKRPDE